MNQALQSIAWDWACRCFGHEHCWDKKVRGLRFAEEAVELAQAVGVDKAQVLKMVENVYGKAPGDEHQELGGVMMTLAVLGHRLGWDLDKCFEIELLRVLAKPPEHFTLRNQAKIDLGLTG
jgi:hypothetical protein